jgi:hypothetical protein
LNEIVTRGHDPNLVLFTLERSGSTARTILPPRSQVISEKYLLNRFEQKTRRTLVGVEGFTERHQPYGPPEIVYCPPGDPGSWDGGWDGCFTSRGCGCAEIILELAFLLRAIRFQHLIILTPDECHTPVNGAAQASVQGLNLLERITVVSGLGRMLGVGPDSRKVLVWQYSR